MLQLLREPWPWYVAGPLLGLFPALLLFVGNRLLGVSATLRHMCAAVGGRRIPYFGYDWRREGGWNIAFAVGILLGGVVAGYVFANPEPVAIAERTRGALFALGVRDFSGFVPGDLFDWGSLAHLRGWVMLVGGGFMVGFGTAYAGGCTSGHGLSGIADLQISSVIALVAFFVGGLIGTFVILPLVLGA